MCIDCNCKACLHKVFTEFTEATMCCISIDETLLNSVNHFTLCFKQSKTHIIVSKRSRPDLRSASVCENNGYNSFRQRFCTHLTSLNNFLVKPGCQTGHAYSRIEQIIEQ